MNIPVAMSAKVEPVTVTIHRPLLGVWAVVAILGLSEDAVLGMLQDGQIGYGFDFRTPGAKRSEARIFAPSLSDYMLKRQGIKPPPRRPEEVIHCILPGYSGHLPATLIQRQFCCSQALVAELIQQNCLEVAVWPEAKSGPNASPRVSRASAEKFLMARRITG